MRLGYLRHHRPQQPLSLPRLRAVISTSLVRDAKRRVKLTLLRYMEDERANELDNSIRVGDPLFYRDDTVDHVNESIVEGFLASEFDATRWNLLPNRRCLTMDLGECYDVFAMARDRDLALHEDRWYGIGQRV